MDGGGRGAGAGAGGRLALSLSKGGRGKVAGAGGIPTKTHPSGMLVRDFDIVSQGAGGVLRGSINSPC